MIKLLFTSSTSACFEWQNDLPYYYGEEYTICLDGKCVYSGSTNVFSLYGLLPNTKYTLTSPSLQGELEFTTRSESAAFSVRDFGAVGDGKTDDTVAVQSAINCLPKNGRLYFPEGTYLVAPLCLKSHITLEFSRGARLLGSADRSRYPVIPGKVYDLVSGEEFISGVWEGNAVPMHQALIFAENAEDITIVGPGEINGNAPEAGWWINVKDQPYGRPRLMFFNRCDGVRVHGIHACDSASWQMHPFFSKNVSFLDMFISAPKDSPNTDAIDPEACDLVNIIGCRFSVGDDCVAIKSGKIEIGQKYQTPANRHTIRNCLMEFGHGAVTLGSEMAGGVTNLAVNRCVFRQTDRGLRIKTRRGRGKHAVIDGVVFENIKMEGVLTPIVMNMWYNCCDPDRNSEYVWSRETLPVDDRTPYLGKFTFKNMICEDCEAAACYCDGLPERPIDEINVENIVFTFSPDAKPSKPAMREFMEDFCRVGMYFDNVNRLTVSNVSLKGVVGDELVTSHIGKLIRK